MFYTRFFQTPSRKKDLPRIHKKPSKKHVFLIVLVFSIKGRGKGKGKRTVSVHETLLTLAVCRTFCVSRHSALSAMLFISTCVSPKQIYYSQRDREKTWQQPHTPHNAGLSIFGRSSAAAPSTLASPFSAGARAPFSLFLLLLLITSTSSSSSSHFFSSVFFYFYCFAEDPEAWAFGERVSLSGMFKSCATTTFFRRFWPWSEHLWFSDHFLLF